MEVTSDAVSLTFNGKGEAAAFAAQLREALTLAYGVRQVEPPWLLRTGCARLTAAARPSHARADTQVSTVSGHGSVRTGPDLAVSDQPVITLSTVEAAKLGGVDRRTVCRWIAGRQIQAYRDHKGGYRVDIASLAAYVSERANRRNPTQPDRRPR